MLQGNGKKGGIKPSPVPNERSSFFLFVARRGLTLLLFTFKTGRIGTANPFIFMLCFTWSIW